MQKGYFIHNLPNEPVTGKDFCFVRTRKGMAGEPYVNDYVYKTRNLNIGLYQYPLITAGDAYEHSSKMVEDCSTFNTKGFGEHGVLKWCVLNACYINDLEFITNWVKNFNNQIGSIGARPVIFITYDKWNAICKGDDVLTVAGNLTKAADLCISVYNVEKPVLPAYSQKLYWWEYQQNYVYLDEAGIACADSLVSTSPTDTSDDASTIDDDTADSTTLTAISGGLFPLNSKTSIEWDLVHDKVVPTEITVKAIEEGA